jgi:hypothetical protein
MSELLKLAERCEAATGPDRELDKLIHEALGNCVHRETEYYAVQSDTGFTCKACRKDTYGFTIPKYSASLDAAMTLVPEGWAWSLNSGAAGECFARVSPKSRLTVVDAATPALALCAAALSARASQ